MSDPDLFDSIAAERRERAERPRARASDPATSQRAGERSKAFAWSHRDAILGALWRPMTAGELAPVTALTVVQIDRRMPELQAEGLVRLTGDERGGMRVWQKVLPNESQQ